MSLTEQVFTAISENLTIDQMTEHDLLEVVEMEESSGLSRWGWAAYYAELQGNNRNLMLVARIANGERRRGARLLAGYIVGRLGADELHINNFAVRDNYRRQGLGRALLRRMLDIGKDSGVARAFLELRAGNIAALALYEECDFRVTARRRNYYAEPVEDALVMTRELVRNA